MTRPLWWCGSSSLLLGAAVLGGGCYSPAKFHGDGAISAGGTTDPYRYRVECGEVDLGEGGLTRLRLAGLPAGEFEFALEGDEATIRRVGGHDRWTIRLFYCEHDRPAANVAGGRVVDEHWAVSGPVRGGAWRLTPRKWNPALPVSAPGRSYDVVIEVKGEAVTGAAKVKPVLEWTR